MCTFFVEENSHFLLVLVALSGKTDISRQAYDRVPCSHQCSKQLMVPLWQSHSFDYVDHFVAAGPSVVIFPALITAVYR